MDEVIENFPNLIELKCDFIGKFIHRSKHRQSIRNNFDEKKISL